MTPARVRALAMGSALCFLRGVALAQVPDDGTPQADAAQPQAGGSGGDVMAGVILAGRANPLGLSLQVDVWRDFRLHDSPGLAFSRNFIRPGLTVTVSPARVHGGPTLTLQPTSFLGFRASYQGLKYFGTFGHLHSFARSEVDWSEGALKRYADGESNADSFSERKASGTVARASAYLQAKAGPVVGRVEGGVLRFGMDLSGLGHRYFYDPGEDLLFRNAKPGAFVDSDVLLEDIPFEGLRAGAGVRHVDARIRAGTRRERSRNTRVGPTAIYALDETTFVALLAHWYVTHPYRAEGAGAKWPNATLAFASDFELGRSR